MMECGTILQRLSAYLEGSVSSEEERFIEEHLLLCQPCSSVLRELKRAGELVRDLKEVEPPAWMAQKVLARIRREQEAKKGIFEKLFFPLRIKVPIQATATVLIAVLAIYVFKAGEPELKKVQSPIITEEVSSKAEGLKQPSAPAAEVILAPGGKTMPQKLPEPREGQDVSRTVEEKQVEEKRKEEVVLPDREKLGEVAPLPETTSQPPHPVAGAGRTEEYGVAKDSLVRERKAPAAAAPLRAAAAKRAEAARISVQVRDVKMAAAEMEDLLRQFGATSIEKESLQDAEIITAELQSEKIEEFIEKLRFRGEIKGKELPSPIPKGETRIRVEILGIR